MKNNDLKRTISDLREELRDTKRKKKRLQRLATILAVPYLLLTLPLSLPVLALFRYRRFRKSKQPQKLGKVHIARMKLETLGLTAPALKELDDKARTGDSVVRAYAARDIALFHMRQKTAASYKTALSYLRVAYKFAPNYKKFLATLATSELLCYQFLGQDAEGAKAYELAVQRGHVNPDVSLAWVNHQPSPEAKMAVINQVLDEFSISALTLLPDTGQSPYDRLTSAVDLPEVNDGPKLTVLVAAYEAQDTLATALRSLQEQTYKNLEIIVIDDCSPTPGTIEVAQGYAEGDSRIKVVRMAQNGGAYVARNHGLDMATGKYVTLHDADDWSHPTKIDVQVRFMEDNPNVIGCTSQTARTRSDISFTRWTGRGKFIITNTSSFMFRREKVRQSLGYWDTVRVSADNELIRRIRSTWDCGSVRSLKTGPLSFQRDSESSVIADDVLGINGFLYGARKEYRDAQLHFHNSSADLRYERDSSKRPFPAPLIMLPDRRKAMEKQHIPVIMGSELRMQGGSLESCIQEIRATRAAGHGMGVFEMYRYDFGAKGSQQSMLAELRDEIDGDQVRAIVYGEKVSCDLLILRYPPILEHRQRYVPHIDAREIKVIVNQSPLLDYTGRGIRRYHLKQCADNLRFQFGKDAVWYPIGPAIRDVLNSHHADELGHIDLSPHDWNNLIHLPDWKRPARTPHHKLRIGRHSRDSYVKWPATREDIRAAYPETDSIEVHILGGAGSALKLIGSKPSNWVVQEFNAMSPKAFLAELDIFVFFTHPECVEAFGRVILEAMAVGVPVILPESYRPVFGDSALYATPQTAIEVARGLHANPAAYDAQVQKAWDYLEHDYSYAMHARRLKEAGVGTVEAREQESVV